ncbi:hypothetical protein DRW07_14270 [Alteromonas sediminis]|uniref:Phosphate-starvation-inducible E-like protein n=1 Tax=Alteromonas sediminis TaxID=2259342 RepID=A0A3N5Z9K6_9ALTE|nr:phosphate-starvation-inducible PsiE family protein [Alteromonas sediminis]RPJ65968.1 hypothetical protein DRW07_14270 [Alteromonas sediminis]
MHNDDHHLSQNGDWLMNMLNKGISQIIRVLAVMMVVVIVLCVADVGFVIYEKLTAPPQYLLSLNDIFAVFASFLAVLIAIEIFANITLYLRDDVIHIRLVVATALMAIARKVIVLDFTTVTPEYVYGIGIVVLALGITYYLVTIKART